MRFFIVFLMLMGGKALAVGGYRPACETEHDAVDSRKENLDKCIAKFEENHHRGDKDLKIASMPEKDVPCVAELRALMVDQENLSQCMENRIWWKSKTDKK